jgi:protocatechuate 3,4-dioxygenase beta subunit
MERSSITELSRRALLKALAILPFGLLSARIAAKPLLEPTPEIPDEDDDQDPTPSQTEGPFFKTKTPERVSLKEKGILGTSLIVTGQVLDTSGKPIKGALLDFWHCDAEGDYDNVGFKLRGHQFTDADGKYRLETIFPGEYPGRTRHIHVKVQPKGGRVLTTQMYFPGEPRNARDGIFDRRLVMKMEEKSGEKLGAFDFVVRV